MMIRLSKQRGKNKINFAKKREQEQKAIKDKQRESRHKRGYGYRWQKLRLIILARDPICKICGRAASTDVDHIIPKSKGGLDAVDNLQGLCHSCHSRKTASEDGGYGH